MKSDRSSVPGTRKVNSVRSGSSSILQPWHIQLSSPTSPRPFSDPNSIRKTQSGQLKTSISSSSTGIKLSFFQRHFTRSVQDDTVEKSPGDRQFSVRSRGFIITAVLFVAILFAAVAAILALSLHNRSEKVDTPGVPSKNSSSPIHPAIMQNFPDPSLLWVNGTWYAYATNNAAGILHTKKDVKPTVHNATYNVQLATSPDLIYWDTQSLGQSLLPDVGNWALQGYNNGTPSVPKAHVWAPSIIKRPLDDMYILYYSGVPKDAAFNAHHTRPHCIGAAISDGDLPAGSFIPFKESMICATAQGGAIDQYPFLDDDGSLYLAYKVDGNSLGHGGQCSNTVEPIVSTPIMLQKLKSDGITLDGKPTHILDRTDSDGPLVEAPAIVRSKDGVYFLFFSSGCTAAPSYNIKYATATRVNGPYTRASTPLLSTGDWDLHAPGSVGIGQDGNGQLVMAFHARTWLPYGGVRAMYTAQLKLEGELASLNTS